MTELERLQQAKNYIELLAQGIDPVRQRELRREDAVNNVCAVRCFFYISSVLQGVIDSRCAAETRGKKRDFAITPRQLALVRPVQRPVGITDFTRMLHQAAGDPEMKLLNGMRITDWLLEQGFLEKYMSPEGKISRVPTDMGQRIGIRVQQRRGQRGEYTAVLYDAQAQQFLLDHFWEIVVR